jgi:hypothetical protein
MANRFWIAGVVMLALAVGARSDDTAGKKTSATPPAGFERLKKLAGTWVEADKDGKPTDKVVSVIKVSAGGSIVHETLFPGQDSEMISIYNLEGKDLVLTHYCILGNQPRMKADPNSPSNQLCFKFSGGANLDPAKDMHMHEGTLTFIDDDHYEFSGCAWADGKPAAGHECKMTLVRKK